ncbi:hypothetical protein [Sphingobacterium tabacisoli]|uniref:Uncharacterized protein n=1 Tax=Sphingobacterium tabacisoli TaxID=2044855 RepID=A0ABW5KYV8_9SPHI|nr:hypothetical protein [Sphingobacterium tabacisoli]
MNKFNILFLICCCPFVLFAQKKKKQDYTFQNVEKVALDGNLTEWSDKLYNPESDFWSFGVSKNGDKLFIAVRVKDDMLQREALRNGVFVNISYNEKKKEGAKLVYPFVDRERLRALSQDDGFDANNIKDELLKSVRGYLISGFSKVVDGLLSFDNTYGIQAVARFDEQNVLVYESVIPLELIDFKSDRVAVQVGINTQFFQMKKTGDSRNRPSNVQVYGAGPTGTVLKNPYKEETMVWLFGTIK